MKYSILLYITALAARIVNCGLIYATNTLQYPYLTPYAFKYSYLNSPSFLIPYTYTTSDNIIKEYISKHHHPDHHGTDDNWKPPSQAGQSQSTEISSEQSQSTDTLIANKPDNDGNKLPITPQLQSTADVNAEANIPINQIKYIPLSTPITYTIPTPLTWPTAAQFHQQDNIGQYYYGYANPISSKQEIKTLDGITRGAYSFIDANGQLQTVQYISDDINGFRVAATNLPKAPETINIPDSPDIIKAKEEHFQAQKEALDRLNAANNNTSDDNKPQTDENDLNSQ